MRENRTGPIIVIPAYCPDYRLIKLINEIRKKTTFPIIILDDGSGSKYKDIFILASEVSECFVYNNKINEGKGSSLKKAVKYAIKKYPNNSGYITCDADGQHMIDDILNVAKALVENKNSLILGTRDFNSRNVPKKSKIGNKISSIIFYLITGVKCRDTQTGLRGIQREYEEIFIRAKGDRYEFEMNFLINMAKKKNKIIEVEIKTIYINNNEQSHYRAFKDSFRIFNGIFKYASSSIISAIVDLGLFTIFNITLFRNFSVGILLSTILARIFSGMVNFLLNQRWVFKGKKDIGEAVKYIILFVSQMVVSGILVSLLSSMILNATFSKIVVDCLLFILSYFIQKKFIFGKNDYKKRKRSFNTYNSGV